MKRLIAAAISAVLAASMLGGCGSKTTDDQAPAAKNAVQADAAVNEDGTETEVIGESDTETEVTGESDTETEVPEEPDAGTGDDGASAAVFDGVSYVMIYNPYIGDYASTGSIGDEIDISIQRAGDMSTEAVPNTISQGILNELGEDFDIQPGSKASTPSVEYEEGDTEDFYYFSDVNYYTRSQAEFECVYAGDYCNIWSLGTAITGDNAEKYGSYFDENIYEQDVAEFGEPRFADEGGKVNFLFYSMDVYGLCGFFWLYDLLTPSDAGKDFLEENMLNSNMEILNMNADLIDDPYLGSDITIESTMSHEFQHLILGSDELENANFPVMETWLNEAMSAYAEDLIFPGYKEDAEYNIDFYLSANFRYGQSLYNFDITGDENIGAYGAVYLFENYLRQIAGESIFKDIHSAWRDTDDPNYSAADVLAECVPADVVSSINDSIAYTSDLEDIIDNENEEFLSKLAYNFFIETLSKDIGNLGRYTLDVRYYMIYDQLDPAWIEGGGRIVVATQDGTFTIPEDAEEGLVYVGLDEDFNPVTGPVIGE